MNWKILIDDDNPAKRLGVYGADFFDLADGRINFLEGIVF